MDIDKIKSIDIVDFMLKNGYKQGKGRSGKWRSFYSPFGSESNASFKCDVNDNRWVDYSAGITRKHSIIDLVMMLPPYPSFKEACDVLLNDTDLEARHFEPKKKMDGTKVHSESKPFSKDLISMLTDIRCIDYALVMKYCVEIVISFPMGANPEQTFRVIGMKNDLGGVDYRGLESWLKLSTSPKSFTTIKGSDKSNVVRLYEGFLDFLSHLTLTGEITPKHTSYVLNGLGMAQVLIPFISDKEIHYYCDNDSPSDNLLKSMSDLNVKDKRFYCFYKDLNDYICDL